MIKYFIKFVNHLNDFWIYLHFAIYRYNYIFFSNIFFNHLISISKWDFFWHIFFWFWNTLFQVLFTKNDFNINLVDVQKHVVSKVVFMTIIFCHCNVFFTLIKILIFFEKIKVDSKFSSKRIWKLDLHPEWCTPKLLDGLNCESKNENNGRRRNWGMLPSS